VTFQKPPPYTRPKAFSDLFPTTGENTSTVAAPGSAPASILSLTYVLERGVDTEGGAPMSFAGGQEHEPISLGSLGDFRIEGRGVLELHGFMLVDGGGIYLCSVDLETPLIADGKRIPLEWTRVGVPCTLALGRARAVLRTAVTATDALRVESEPATNPRAPQSATDEVRDDAPTPLHGVQAVDPPPPARPPTRSRPSSAPLRPNITPDADDESTLVAPDRANSTGKQKPLGDDVSTKRANEVLRPSAPPPAPQPPPPPAISAPPKSGYAPPMQGRGRTPHVYPPPPPLAVAPTAPQPQPLRALPATVATRKPPKGGLPPGVRRVVDALAADLAPGSARRVPILVSGALLVTACLGSLTFVTWRAASAAHAGGSGGGHVAVAPLPANPAATAVKLGVVITPAPARKAVDDGTDPASKGPTLERTAVDILSRGDVPQALAAYRQLASEQPDNPAFAEVVHVLEQRAASGNGAP